MNERLIYTWLGYGPDRNGVYPNRPILDMNTWHREVAPKLHAEGVDIQFAWSDYDDDRGPIWVLVWPKPPHGVYHVMSRKDAAWETLIEYLEAQKKCSIRKEEP
jgi:hypothetical protein